VLNPLDHADEARLKRNAPVNAPALVLLIVPAIAIAIAPEGMHEKSLAHVPYEADPWSAAGKTV